MFIVLLLMVVIMINKNTILGSRNYTGGSEYKTVVSGGTTTSFNVPIQSLYLLDIITLVPHPEIILIISLLVVLQWQLTSAVCLTLPLIAQVRD